MSSHPKVGLDMLQIDTSMSLGFEALATCDRPACRRSAGGATFSERQGTTWLWKMAGLPVCQAPGCQDLRRKLLSCTAKPPAFPGWLRPSTVPDRAHRDFLGLSCPARPLTVDVTAQRDCIVWSVQNLTWMALRERNSFSRCLSSLAEACMPCMRSLRACRATSGDRQGWEAGCHESWHCVQKAKKHLHQDTNIRRWLPLDMKIAMGAGFHEP